MLTRENVFEISREGYRLLNLQAAAVGRKLRRFLERVSANGLVIQSFAFGEGHTVRQLQALEVYAQYIAREAEAWLPADVATYQGAIRDDAFGLVANHYRLQQDVPTATVAQLRKMVELVVVLSDGMHEFVGNANRVALAECPEYIYRNLPCSIVTDDKLWCVSGSDVRGGSGVLEWCYDEDDARYILESMQRFPERFTGIKVEKWSDVVAADLLEEQRGQEACAQA